MPNPSQYFSTLLAMVGSIPKALHTNLAINLGNTPVLKLVIYKY